MTHGRPAVPDPTLDQAKDEKYEAVGNAVPHGECTCLAYLTPGSPSVFDDWTVDADPYCPRHGNESDENASP